MANPLTGIRVIDASNFVFGPVATQILADMGAEVIKVEPPEGDPMRLIGAAKHPKMASFFLNLNRNKQSVVLDLKTVQGLSTFKELLETADVFVHNMRPEAAKRLGISYEDLSALNPKLVYAVALGFHPDGQYANRPAYDDVIQGLSGLAGLNARMGGEPQFMPMLFADKLCGVYLSSAVSMALFQRERTGLGQQVQVPMFETVASFNLLDHLADGAFVAQPEQNKKGLGYGRVLSQFHRPLKTKDGYICLVANTDAQWHRLFKLFEREDLATDKRFRTIGDRVLHVAELYGIAAQCLLKSTTQSWLTLFQANDIPASPSNDLDDLLSDPHLNEVGFFHSYEHKSEGSLRTIKTPMIFSEGVDAPIKDAPRLGEHTEDILSQLFTKL